MTLRIHILTSGFASPNSRAFLFPLIAHRRRLRAAGVDIRLLHDAGAPGLVDCDVLFAESRVFSHRWAREGDAAVVDTVAGLAAQAPLAWFDISYSTGWLQVPVLAYVRRYYKSQLLRDRTLYQRAHYGNRIWADYYHREFGIADEVPSPARAVDDARLLDRLAVSWHSGLADYSYLGPARMALRRHVRVDALLRHPTAFTPPERARPVDVACRMGSDYARATVAWQRRQIAARLAGRAVVGKLPRRRYLAEMRRARIVVSPFGFGEITLKDFEAMLCGAALVKPDMAHLETWPDLFVADETMTAHRWDLTDFDTVVAALLDDDDRRRALAGEAQARYRAAIATDAGAAAFCARVRAIVDDALTPPANDCDVRSSA